MEPALVDRSITGRPAGRGSTYQLRQQMCSKSSKHDRNISDP